MISWLPMGGAEAAAVFGLTFVTEDAAVLSGAALAAGGVLPWPMAFAACFLGIWLGDLWLYGMARRFGAPFAKRFGVAPALERSRGWFEKRGSLVLIAVRFLPGLRLPSYLAAGAMRFSLTLFTFVTGIAAALWVGLVFIGGHVFGAWLAMGAVSVAGASVVMRMRRGVRAGAAAGDRGARGEECRGAEQSSSAIASRRSWWARVVQWEFWPAWLFYAPVAVLYLWLAIRHRGFTLPTAANPGMPLGGLVGESKFDTLRLLALTAPESVAPTWHIASGDLADRVTAMRRIVDGGRVAFPFIMKPDVGQRGVGVKLIRSIEAARAYLAVVDGPVLVQRYAPGPHEAGVFYYRRPGEAQGRIFAVTDKVFPHIEGDGERTIEQLILDDSRAAIMAATYLRRFADRRDEVLAPGETLKLVEAGNHAQGCIFRDGMHLATPELLAAIDHISQTIPGFFIGRYDVRYADEDELRAGRGFTILELNGASSEATSIYDARTSLLAAYRTLHRQWALVFEISALNRSHGFQPAGIRTVFREWRQANAAIRTYPSAD